MGELFGLLWGDEGARQARRSFSRVGWALAILLILQGVGQYVLLSGLSRYCPAALEHPLSELLVAVVSSYGLAFPAAILLLRTLPAYSPRQSAPVPLRRGVVLWLLSMGGVYLANFLTLGLMELWGSLRGAAIYNPVESMGEQPVLFNLLLSCVLAPLAEEFLFRRTLIDRLRPWGDGFALCASALAFALIHVNPYQMLYAFVVGILFGLIYLRTGRVGITVALHAGVNVVSAGLLPLALALGEGGAMVLSLLVLGSIGWTVSWLVRGWRTIVQTVQNAQFGDGITWGQFLVNGGMTVFCLLAVYFMWLLVRL